MNKVVEFCNNVLLSFLKVSTITKLNVSLETQSLTHLGIIGQFELIFY